MKKYYLGKLVSIQHIPGYDGGEIKPPMPVFHNEYQVFEDVNIRETHETNDDGSGGEYAYSCYNWVIIQEIIPII